MTGAEGQGRRYLLISPCRDEARYMRQTLDSVLAQSIRPAMWVIVDDGSTDETPEVLARYSERHPWIRIVTRSDRGRRSVGPGVVDAFYAGYETVEPEDYDYLCKLDLDLRLPPRYFETLMSRMEADPRIATCSGKAYVERNGTLVSENHGDDTSLGMTKFYRVSRFRAIGGFVREVMWDGIDCHRCRMMGWTACSWDDPELRFVHLRSMGSSQQSIYAGRMRHGYGQYYMGTGFAYMLASSIYRLAEKPYVLGGLAILLGWVKSALERKPRYHDPRFRAFLRRYQRRVLLAGKSRALSEILQGSEAKAELAGGFARNVHCILGLPFDAMDMPELLERIRVATAARTRCFLSTPNLNWAVACRTDAALRNSVIDSDLSVADGMPLVWVARLLGVPVPERVAGSDVFERIRAGAAGSLAVYFFGGAQGAAETACRKLNGECSPLVCAGFKFPGFGSIEDMSAEETIAEINASGADFVIVSLGAKKGQAWIERNRQRLNAPVVSHLGAVVNFVAGTHRRAPRWVQRAGLEWLWRVKEEPGLWRRYAGDGWVFAKLFATRVLPYALYLTWRAVVRRNIGSTAIEKSRDAQGAVIRLRGPWTAANLRPLRECLERIAGEPGDLVVDLGRVTDADSAFLGLLMLLHGERRRRGLPLTLAEASAPLARLFRLCCAEFLLDAS